GPSEACPHDVARISAPRHRPREARRPRRGRAARHGREGACMTQNILPTTTVGSFGKPDYLTKARAQQARGKLGATELEELERKATVEWIRRQEEIGLDVLVDRDEARDLERSGAKYIQIDEPGIHARPEEIEIAIEAMGIVTAGLSAKTISHICYGDFAAIYPQVLDLPVDQLDLAMANYG